MQLIFNKNKIMFIIELQLTDSYTLERLKLCQSRVKITYTVMFKCNIPVDQTHEENITTGILSLGLVLCSI